MIRFSVTVHPGSSRRKLVIRSDGVHLYTAAKPVEGKANREARELIAEYFSVSETILRTFYYIDYKDLGQGKFIFTKFLAINNLEQGQKTFLTNENISTDSIPNYVFSKAFLEEQSR